MPLICQAQESQWQLKKNKDNIKVYQKQLDGFKLKHHKAITVIDVKPQVVLAVLQDSDACPQWVHDCKVNQMVEMIDLTHRIFYTNIAAPLFLKDRDMYLKSDIDFSFDENKYVIKLNSLPTYGETHKNRVRVIDVQMVWTIKTLSQDQTEVTYQVYIDPKTPIKTFVNRAILDSVLKTMQGLRDITKLKKYQ